MAITFSCLAISAAVLTTGPQSVSASAQTMIKPVVFEAAPETSQTMTYELYAGGIHAVQATLDVQHSPKNDQYRLFLSANTRGFLGKLVPWSGSFETYGWSLSDDIDKPKLHESISLWRNEEEIKTYSYAKDGKFLDLKITEAGVDKSPKNLEDELVQNSIDAMTAALEVMRAVGNDKPCEGTSEVFDGKRRFKMKFKHDADETLKKTDYNVYSGIASRCVVEVEPMTGAWHKKPRGWLSIQEQGRDKGALPTLWLAKLDEDSPAVPVKLRIKTDYGTLFMHMVEYKHGDKVISASSKK